MPPRVNFRIDGKPVGGTNRTFVVAEVAQAHDGSLGMAHAFIDAAAASGADAVKFQTHFADAEFTLDEPFRVLFSQQDQTRYDYWRRIEFSEAQWDGLVQHVRQRGLIFLSSPFSTAAVEMLTKLGVGAWKVASGEFQQGALLDAMVSTRLPLLLSTGMASWGDVDEIVDWLNTKAVPFGLLQCTSCYPTPLEQVGLNVLGVLQEKHQCPVGLSDHSGSIFPALTAIARGADIVELHATFHKGIFGPDVSSSVTFEDLSLICQMRDAVQLMNDNPVDKNTAAEDIVDVKQIFSRSLAPRSALAAGTILAPRMLTSKKPGGGIPPECVEALAGRRLARDVSPNRILRWDDLVDKS